MRTQNDSLIPQNNFTVTGSFISEAIPVNHIVQYAIELGFMGASGTVKLQCSADKDQGLSEKPVNYKVINWADISGSLQTISGNDYGLYDVSDVGYNWVRIVITGNCVLTYLRINGKGL